MKLRSIELALPDPGSAAAFLADIWGMAPTEGQNGSLYLRGSGGFPYLVALHEAEVEHVRSTTFVCETDELAGLAGRVAATGWPARAVRSSDPGGGSGIEVELPEGEIFRFLAGATDAEPIKGRDLPVKLTHVVFNSQDAEASGRAVEEVLGFRVSDRTKGMVFVRCNRSHHSTAFARAGFSSLNHVAFEMSDVDAVMRGIGRLRDHGMAPSWGPGRHGPGDNVFAYFIAPFGPVVEFSTAVAHIPEDYRVGAPEDWTWPEGRIDQWGMSGKDLAGLRAAEQRFRFRRDWDASPLGAL
ncbi:MULTISPECIES: VOC family protein [unclassified Sphingopyxis]|uniref:VOC family protein n=1 Tax=unclassified Sphingopyxis TaxID=2614943 RepID=UPI002864BF86|nr:MULTISPECIES: VOC family protein [unclassified Sphingopyxis]MDR6832594.1 catechol 2,3-dioxygenase-like lactoylglutathione lyase family enzyme [Sphingopyxis sp. BE122]MDR7228337.1 catechol 2,3-dioxygenase-like lactoylglutathione lyase family enzyme [Sphingopyxis sp. BE259]